MILQQILNKKKAKPEKLGPRIIQVPRRQAGITVTHDNALEAAAFFACIRVISEDMASLPWHAFQRRSDGGRDPLVNSHVQYLINQRANPDMSAYAFRETLNAWAMSWGNGYAEIERDNAGRPAWLWPICPDRVEVDRDGNGNVVYDVANSAGPNTVISSRDMFHVHGLGFDGLVGYSIVSLASRSLGLSISLEEFGAQFFGNGATLGGILEVPEESSLSDDGKKNLRNTFNKRHQGASKAHGVEILDGGVKYKEVGVEPDKGQFIESHQHQVEVIARWCRVPPHKIGHLLRMTFNNVEQLSIDYVQGGIIPWARRFEEEANFKLFGLRDRNKYTKINTNALMRGDTETRGNFYNTMWNLGAFSVNEIRELEDRNPVPDGDKRFVQLNMTTLEKAGEDPEPTAPPVEQSSEDEPENDEVQNTIVKALYHELSVVNGIKSRYKDANEFFCWVCGDGRDHSFRKAMTILDKNDAILSVNGPEFVEMYKNRTRQMLFDVFNGVKIDVKAIASNIASYIHAKAEAE